ncbi:Protein CBG25885 [Caenorhabditis briggsae]|uniref:Protein CBG25885 n=1 Tax=Caenorhabditis briggsae TaxID=6238 RepID=B6IHP0_CAEBR|nr:Protein CBG25885 [Caenorhabditis briggsae]CAR99396.1 Protein CBG25885 [Caenorhabditis briggsae]
MARSKLISRSNFLEKRCPKLRLFYRFTVTVNYCITRFDCVLPVDSCRFTAGLEAEASGKQCQLWTLNSTTHLIDDVNEQSKYVASKIAQISGESGPEQYEGLYSIQTMLCEGSFTLWEQNFAKLLIAVFHVLSKSDSDANKKVALRVLTKMCTSQASRLFDSTEMAICKVLDAAVNSAEGTMNVTADDCLKTLATHLPLAKVVNICKEKIQEAKASLVLKMMTRLFEGLQADELSPIIEDLAPCAIQAYDSPSSVVRKTAVYCLVAMVNKLGMQTMNSHLQRLSAGKMNLVQVYVNRAMSSSTHSHV